MVVTGKGRVYLLLVSMGVNFRSRFRALSNHLDPPGFSSPIADTRAWIIFVS